MSKKSEKQQVKTHFKGPGEWRSQARELEKDDPKGQTKKSD